VHSFIDSLTHHQPGVMALEQATQKVNPNHVDKRNLWCTLTENKVTSGVYCALKIVL
jgi:hypothetical protein